MAACTSRLHQSFVIDRSSPPVDHVQRLIEELSQTEDTAYKLEIICELGNIAINSQGRLAMMEARGIPALIEMLSSIHAEAAMRALGNLSADALCREAIGRAPGVIVLLVELMVNGTDSQQTAASSALAQIGLHNESNKAAILEAGAKAPLEALAMHGTKEQSVRAARALHNLLEKSDEAEKRSAAAAAAAARRNWEAPKPLPFHEK
jgi:hypothetical protein